MEDVLGSRRIQLAVADGFQQSRHGVDREREFVHAPAVFTEHAEHFLLHPVVGSSSVAGRFGELFEERRHGRTLVDDHVGRISVQVMRLLQSPPQVRGQFAKGAADVLQ